MVRVGAYNGPLATIAACVVLTAALPVAGYLLTLSPDLRGDTAKSTTVTVFAIGAIIGAIPAAVMIINRRLHRTEPTRSTSPQKTAAFGGPIGVLGFTLGVVLRGLPAALLIGGCSGASAIMFIGLVLAIIRPIRRRQAE